MSILEDKGLQDFLHDWIVQLSGLSAVNVRPSWQQNSVGIPDLDVDWCAFRVTDRQADVFSALVNTPVSTVELRRHEKVTLLTSFYGPNADYRCTLFRDGMQISDNRTTLIANGYGLVSCGESLAVPELLKEKWTYRIDLKTKLIRQLVTEYPLAPVTRISVTTNGNENTVSVGYPGVDRDLIPPSIGSYEIGGSTLNSFIQRSI